MKAYIETIVITNDVGTISQPSNSLGGRGGDITHTTSRSSIFNTVIEFEDRDQFIRFSDQVDTYEKGQGFEIYRTITPIY